MIRTRTLGFAAILLPLTVARCTCNEGLGSAAPPVPDIDVCVKPAPDAAGEVCYQAEKNRLREDLCRGIEPGGECRLASLTANLGRVVANSSGALEVRVVNKGFAPLRLLNPPPVPGNSGRFRLDPAQPPGPDAVYLEVPGRERLPGGDAGPEQTKTFNVTISGTVCGPHSARILLRSNDAEVPETAPGTFDPGQPDSPIELNVEAFVGGPCICPLPPSRLDFGEVAVSQKKVRRFSFENCGDEDLTLSPPTIGVNAGDPGPVFGVEAVFYPANNVLAPGLPGSRPQAHIDVHYRPDHLAPPTDEGQLWVPSNAPTAQPHHIVPLSGLGTPRPACVLNAVPSVANFGSVSGSLARTFRVFNSGQIACRLYEVVRTSGSPEFTLTGGDPALAPGGAISLQPNQSHSLEITYAPGSDQYDEALFTATADDIDAFLSAATIAVSGNPVVPTEGCYLDIQPDFGDFGDVSVGGQSTVTFNIKNASEGDILDSYCNISSASLPVGLPDYRLGEVGFIGNFLPPGGVLTVSLSVFFEPQSEGVKTGILRFNSNDVTGAARDIPLWGNALGAKLCVDPTGAAPATGQCGTTQPCAVADFGFTTTEVTKDITLTNCGAGVLRIRGLNMDPAGGLAFVKTAPPASALPLELGAGASATVSIKYRPTNPAGDFGAFEVLSNASDANLARVDLRGNYDGDCPTILRCTPNPVQFGSHEVGVAATQTAVCSNFGSQTMYVNNVTLAGDSSFSVVSATYGELQPGQSFVVQLQCTPQNPGAKTGQVTITSDACDVTPYTFAVNCTGLEIDIPECLGSSTFEPVEKWRWTGTPDYPQYDDVWMTPVVINLTDDNSDGAVDVLDIPDVVFTALKSTAGLAGGGGGQGMSYEDFCKANDAQPAVVVAVRGDTGQQLWTWGTLPVSGPDDPNALAMEVEGTLAAADIDADGKPEIIGVKYTYIPAADDCEMTDLECCVRGKYTYGALIALEHDGTFKWESERWHQDEYVLENAGAPSIGDMDGDGLPEITFGNAIFDRNGLLLFEGLTQGEGVQGHGEGGAGHGPISVLVDLDLDGMNELVAGRTAFKLGRNTPLFDRRDIGDGLTTIANLDADPAPEIIILTGGNDLYVLEHDGTTKYGPIHIASGNVDENGNEEGFISTNPAVGDVDGDGYPEIVIAATNNLWVFEHTLQVKWSAPINDQTGASGPTTFDFEGDGRAEVLHADEGNVHMFDGVSGALKYQAPRSSRTIVDNPVVADVDNDNHADILLSMESVSSAFGMYGLIVYSNTKNNWVATRRVWNQHAYHITNVSESGIVPAFEGSGWLEHNVYRSNTVRCE